MLHTDIPFARDDANRFLPWMIALMCAVAALMLLVGVALERWVATQHGDFGSRVSVQIPDHGSRQQGLISQVSALLEKTAGVQGVRVLSTDEVARMVSPWLGDTAVLSDLPLPTVMDVTVMAGDQSLDYASLTRQLQAITPDITLDTRATWVEKFSRFSRIAQGVIYTLAGTILLALSGMMVFAARAAMKLHASTVQLLHALGAPDAYIARQFQRNALLLAARGAIPGTLIAGTLYLLLSVSATQTDAPLLPRFIFSAVHIALLVALPLICCLLAVLSVRKATLTQLRKLP